MIARASNKRVPLCSFLLLIGASACSDDAVVDSATDTGITGIPGDGDTGDTGDTGR